MLNEPQDHQPQRVHPLERAPQAVDPAEVRDEQQQQVMLHIPVVKPYVTIALIVVNLIIFAVGQFSATLGQRFILDGANNQLRVIVDGEYLRLLFAMFLHGSLSHIFINMYSLYVIGSTLESLFGHVRFALIYFLGGLTGSIVSVLFNPPMVNSVGASGAVFAIFGAQLVYLYQHRKLLGAGGRRQFRNLLVIAVMNLAVGILSSLGAGTVRIDNWGHIGGLIGGVALTWYIGPLFLLRRHPQREGAFLAEDVNPLAKRSSVISVYSALLIAILIAATFVMR
ncbi:MAG: rhomboid family intramembrane serine protease [Armatimonadetes bacterium]|nr:rhomboid family intramembrane serine protease [Anaerolineae bacterium]